MPDFKIKPLRNSREFLLLIFAVHCFVTPALAQAGKDGPKVINALNTVVNEYTSLSVDAAAGSTQIQVNNSALNTNAYFTGPLAPGDLLMIIQVQGAVINGTANDSTWGAITAYNNCGNYEFVVVDLVPNATTINLQCTLQHNYTAAGNVEVIRVPRYTSLTVNSGSVSCTAWNGTSGGIVAVEVQGNTTISAGASIDASQKGFRGGVITNTGGGPYMQNAFASMNINDGGEKGESIAGYAGAYAVYGGRYCRGAAANAGGGGNSWNAAGGGGGNAGLPPAWTGNGNPDITTSSSWVAAWNLEYAGFANSVSSGGGRGGYNVGDLDADALLTGPNSINWSASFYRTNTGGKGGRPLDYSTGRLFLGGGGGSGNEDNLNGGSGGKGGGMIYLLSYGTVSGSGTIVSNGENGGNDVSANWYGDGPGGAGAGGTIIINSTGAISGISLTANGGKGGDQFISNSVLPYESEGGGGGGGGGYIAISNGTVTRQAAGGWNGTTNAAALAEFPPNGGTRGGDGMPFESIAPLPAQPVANAGADLVICNGASVTLSGSAPTGTYTWSPSTGLSCSTCLDPVVTPLVSTSYILEVSNGNCSARDTVTVSVNPAAQAAFTLNPADCPLQFLNLSSNAVSYQWDFGDGTFGAGAAPSHVYATAGSYTVTLIAGAGPGCQDTFSLALQTNGSESTLYIPNAFTPNGDATNDIFKVSSTSISEFEGMIFNRWGELIYSWNDIRGGWDGTFEGKPAQEDVYVCVIKARSSCSGSYYEKRGIVSLLR